MTRSFFCLPLSRATADCPTEHGGARGGRALVAQHPDHTIARHVDMVGIRLYRPVWRSVTLRPLFSFVTVIALTASGTRTTSEHEQAPSYAGRPDPYSVRTPSAVYQPRHTALQHSAYSALALSLLAMVA